MDLFCVSNVRDFFGIEVSLGDSGTGGVDGLVHGIRTRFAFATLEGYQSHGSGGGVRQELFLSTKNK